MPVPNLVIPSTGLQAQTPVAKPDGLSAQVGGLVDALQSYGKGAMDAGDTGSGDQAVSTSAQGELLSVAMPAPSQAGILDAMRQFDANGRSNQVAGLTPVAAVVNPLGRGHKPGPDDNLLVTPKV